MSAPRKKKHKVKVKVQTVQVPITRQQTIDYNKIGFIAPIMIDLIDNLTEQPAYYRQGLKSALNACMKELEGLTEKHFNSYQNFGAIPNPDGAPIDAKNIYNNTAKGYDEILKRNPSEIAQIAELVRRYEAKGNKISEIITSFMPLQTSIKNGD